MPLSGPGLQAAIISIPGVTVSASGELLAFCNALVNYITTNAVVPSGIAVTVNTGSGVGSTTAPGKIT